MKGLWERLSPPLSDTFGFVEIINSSDGSGILDDCAEYKDKGHGQSSSRNRGSQVSRIAVTRVRTADAITGTQRKILETCRECRKTADPNFVMLATAPVSSLMGTDLAGAASLLEAENHIPTAYVPLTGHDTYEAGISQTLIALSALLVHGDKTLPDTVNILGGNTIDWSSDMLREVCRRTEDIGFEVISQIGCGMNADDMARAGSAALNFVVTVSGAPVAEQMAADFDIPYIVAAPMGESWSKRVLESLSKGRQPREVHATSDEAIDGSKCDVLIVSEQIMGNAIRNTLELDYGMENIQVCSFSAIDRTFARQQDMRLSGESELADMLEKGRYQLVIANPLCRCVTDKRLMWIDLPSGGFLAARNGYGMPMLIGEGLNRWLDEQLPSASRKDSAQGHETDSDIREGRHRQVDNDAESGRGSRGMRAEGSHRRMRPER